LANNTTGASNTALGMQALNANTTSSNNTSVGYQAGYSQTTGTGNTSFGSTAGFGTLTGSYNSYFGLNSGTQTVATATGDSNSGFGSSSLRGITSGSSNVGVGSNTLFANTTGSFNTAIGALSLNANTTASNNTAVGYQAAYSGTTGVANTAVGNQAAYSNTTGSNNTAIGLSALLNNTTADNNTAVGYQASFYNTTGASNTAIGYRSLFANTTASNNTAVGYQAGNSNTTGTNNCAVGRFALRSCTTGTENTVLGTDAGDAITTGTDNTLVGYGAGYLMTTGSKNSILGTYSGNQGGLDIRTASNYIVLSDGDGNVRQTIDSSGNVGIGTGSPSSILNVKAASPVFRLETTGTVSSTGTAYNAVRDSTGADVFTYGYQGLANCFQFGTVPAAGFMRFLTGAQVEAMRIDSSGRVFVNQAAGNGNTAQRMGLTYDGNTEWGLSFKNSFSGNVGSAINFNNFAGTQVGTIQPGASSTAYVTTSDYRLKENVKPIAGALNTVSRLKPCTYDWIETKEADIGFIAHELQEVLPNAVRGEKDAVDVDGNPQYQGIDTSFMVATLTAAIQEQQALITTLTARITALEST
jgi:trimeric autotransporter adhesin